MKKEITYEKFESNDFCTKGISNHKLIGSCDKCNCKFEYSAVKKFMRNRKNKEDKKHLWNTCQKCWLKINTSEDEKWIEKNSQAQLIAQNKPEQKIKNALAVSKSWTKERKEKMSDWVKDRWKNDEKFAKQALKNISWTDGKDIDLFNRVMKMSAGSGGLKGDYKEINYDSALELSYILWCFDNNIPIKRYDLPPIEYIAEDGVKRKYFPDFIINSNTIVEIKGKGLFYSKNYERNLKKIKALKEQKLKYVILFSDDDVLKLNYKKARRLHYANKKEENNSIQGESE